MYVGCCLHGMFDEILLFCALFMSLRTTKSLKLVKEMDHPGVFSLRVCKKIKNQNKKLGIGNLLTANPGVCFSFWRKPSQTQHWNVESRNLDLRGRVSDNIFNLKFIYSEPQNIWTLTANPLHTFWFDGIYFSLITLGMNFNAV